MLYIVTLPNDYFKIGAFVESDEYGSVQEVRTRNENGRLRVGGAVGLAVPYDSVRPYLFAILKRGFDDQGAHAEYRGAYRTRNMRSLSRGLEDGFWEEYGGDDPAPDGVET